MNGFVISRYSWTIRDDPEVIGYCNTYCMKSQTGNDLPGTIFQTKWHI